MFGRLIHNSQSTLNIKDVEKEKKFGRLIHNSQFTLNIKDEEKEKQVWKVNSQLTVYTEHKRRGEREKSLEG